MESTDKDHDQVQAEAMKELRALIAKAKEGDASVVPRLRQYLSQIPTLWQGSGNLATQSHAAWIKRIAGQDKHLQECIVQKVNALKCELANEKTPLLEALLVDRVVSTWLQLYYCELRSAQQDETSLKWAEFRLKEADAACSRHAKAIGALATLRKLLPSAQLASEADPVATTTAANEPQNQHEQSGLHSSESNGSPQATAQAHNRIAMLFSSNQTAFPGVAGEKVLTTSGKDHVLPNGTPARSEDTVAATRLPNPNPTANQFG